MKQPAARGTPVSPERIKAWLKEFKFYRTAPDEEAVGSWLSLFSNNHRDLAARILDCVHVVSDEKVLRGYRAGLKQLKGWHSDRRQRRGRWLFVGFGGSGESGQAMLRSFREANDLDQKKFDYLFCGARDLPSQKLTADDHVVFVDDFSGSGHQVCTHWPVLQELIASSATCHLILTAATDRALSRIKTETALSTVVSITLDDTDNVFKCSYFNSVERQIIENYGRKAWSSWPKGYRDCGLVFVLCHKTPNNSIPILHAHNKHWKGLFPRRVPLAGA